MDVWLTIRVAEIKTGVHFRVSMDMGNDPEALSRL